MRSILLSFQMNFRKVTQILKKLGKRDSHFLVFTVTVHSYMAQSCLLHFSGGPTNFQLLSGTLTNPWKSVCCRFAWLLQNNFPSFLNFCWLYPWDRLCWALVLHLSSAGIHDENSFEYLQTLVTGNGASQTWYWASPATGKPAGMCSSKQHFVSSPVSPAESCSTRAWIMYVPVWCGRHRRASVKMEAVCLATMSWDIFFHYIFFLIIKDFRYSWTRTSFLFFALQESSYVSPFLHQPPKTLCVCVRARASVISEMRFGQTVGITIAFFLTI